MLCAGWDQVFLRWKKGDMNPKKIYFDLLSFYMSHPVHVHTTRHTSIHPWTEASKTARINTKQTQFKFSILQVQLNMCHCMHLVFCNVCFGTKTSTMFHPLLSDCRIVYYNYLLTIYTYRILSNKRLGLLREGRLLEISKNWNGHANCQRGFVFYNKGIKQLFFLWQRN